MPCRMKRTFWIALVIFGGFSSLLSVNSFARDAYSINSEPEDSTNHYIEDLTDLLSLKLFTLTNSGSWLPKVIGYSPAKFHLQRL